MLTVYAFRCQLLHPLTLNSVFLLLPLFLMLLVTMMDCYIT